MTVGVFSKEHPALRFLFHPPRKIAGEIRAAKSGCSRRLGDNRIKSKFTFISNINVNIGLNTNLSVSPYITFEFRRYTYGHAFCVGRRRFNLLEKHALGSVCEARLLVT